MKMKIEKALPELTKASNTQNLELISITVNWKEKQVIHNYLVNMYDADGDLVKRVKQETVTLGEDAFDSWISQEMADACLNSCYYNEFPEA